MLRRGLLLRCLGIPILDGGARAHAITPEDLVMVRYRELVVARIRARLGRQGHRRTKLPLVLVCLSGLGDYHLCTVGRADTQRSLWVPRFSFVLLRHQLVSALLCGLLPLALEALKTSRAAPRSPPGSRSRSPGSPRCVRGGGPRRRVPYRMARTGEIAPPRSRQLEARPRGASRPPRLRRPHPSSNPFLTPSLSLSLLSSLLFVPLSFLVKYDWSTPGGLYFTLYCRVDQPHAEPTYHFSIEREETIVWVTLSLRYY
eukprot:scaffold86183_cov30-Tisochrysis_lutea.AAC.3